MLSWAIGKERSTIALNYYCQLARDSIEGGPKKPHTTAGTVNIAKTWMQYHGASSFQDGVETRLSESNFTPAPLQWPMRYRKIRFEVHAKRTEHAEMTIATTDTTWLCIPWTKGTWNETCKGPTWRGLEVGYVPSGGIGHITWTPSAEALIYIGWKDHRCFWYRLRIDLQEFFRSYLTYVISYLRCSQQI